ncbi:MAG TPA: response regulator [Vicinamibacterales bacterium]|nr:response regulator [Vicinamibacterales bacterium]
MIRKKILLADDSNTALMMERTLLAKSAYVVVVARDGREAVRQAIEESPDLIILDVVMPNMTGFEACREIRRLEATRAIPVIMVTTRGGGDDMVNGFEVGCNDYVTKPIHGPELLSKVRNLIGE